MENKQKIDNLILHFANVAPFLNKKKLAKLLYFVDFTYYELKGKSLTGLKYKKWQYGPLPETFYNNIYRMKSEDLIDIGGETDGGISHPISAKQQPNYDVFDKDEWEVIETVTSRYKDEDAGSLERIAQNEPPYKMVSNREEIPYHLAFYRNTFGEMDVDDESPDS